MKDKKELLSPEMHKEIETAIQKCFSCSKCISGCPVAQEMDFPPAVIIKWLAFGEIKKALSSKTIWVCSSCQTCVSRCPFEIDIPHIIDLLKEYAYENKMSGKERATQVFHRTFLSSIKRFGRMHEASFIGAWKLLSGKWFSDLLLGAKMFLKGKLAMLPERIKGQKEIHRLFKPKNKKR